MLGFFLRQLVRPVLDDAVGDSLNLRRQAVHYFSETVCRQAVARSAFHTIPLPQEFLEKCVASHPPPIKVVMPQLPAAKQTWGDYLCFVIDYDYLFSRLRLH